MRSHITFLVLVVTGSLAAAELTAGARKKLVDYVDSLSIPIPAESINGLQPISDGGEELGLKISKVLTSSDQAFRDGLQASLIGTRDRPIAVVFWVQSTIADYYVPFPKVTEIDRPRRLTRIDDRFYRIESNRTAKGVRVEKRLP